MKTENKILISILLFVVVFAACKKDPTTLPSQNNIYTIEGILYYPDGIIPVKGKKLLLAADLGGNGGGGNDYEWPAETTTDDNGYYKLEYKHNGSYNSLDIEQPYTEKPVLGPFLRDIPANQNIKRDINLAARNLLHIKVDLKRVLNDTDTLFVSNLDFRPTNDTIHRYFIKGDPAPIYIYIYTKDKVLENNTWVVKLGQHNNYFPEDYSIRWGLGRENFEKGVRLEINENSGSNLYNVIKYPLKSFPEISEATITIE